MKDWTKTDWVRNILTVGLLTVILTLSIGNQRLLNKIVEVQTTQVLDQGELAGQMEDLSTQVSLSAATLTETFTPLPTNTATPTFTLTVTATFTSLPTNTATPTFTLTFTATPEPAPSIITGGTIKLWRHLTCAIPLEDGNVLAIEKEVLQDDGFDHEGILGATCYHAGKWKSWMLEEGVATSIKLTPEGGLAYCDDCSGDHPDPVTWVRFEPSEDILSEVILAMDEETLYTHSDYAVRGGAYAVTVFE